MILFLSEFHLLLSRPSTKMEQMQKRVRKGVTLFSYTFVAQKYWLQNLFSFMLLNISSLKILIIVISLQFY